MKRLLSAVLAVLLCLSMPGGRGAAAAEAAPWPVCRVFFDGLLSDRGYISDNCVFLSVEALCAFLDLEWSQEADEAAFTLTLPGLTVSGERGSQVARAGSRYLYLPHGWLCRDGKLYLPSDAVERLFGLEISLSEDLSRAELSPSRFQLMDAGEGWYERHFRAEDIYWLEHIIVSESYQQPLAGQIGVGNVVLNRVADPRYPDTVMAVVIDREGGVQFDPAATGGVTMDPDEQSVLAARLCLEGYNTVGDCMYFLNPDKASSRWFEENLTEAIVIGNHAFYH